MSNHKSHPLLVAFLTAFEFLIIPARLGQAASDQSLADFVLKQPGARLGASARLGQGMDPMQPGDLKHNLAHIDWLSEAVRKDDPREINQVILNTSCRMVESYSDFLTETCQDLSASAHYSFMIGNFDAAARWARS